MERKFEEFNVIEAYEKPFMQIIEMETETVLMQGTSKTSQDSITNSLVDDDDKGGSSSALKTPTRSYTPQRNTKPYMGDSEE